MSIFEKPQEQFLSSAALFQSSVAVWSSLQSALALVLGSVHMPFSLIDLEC